MSSLLLAFLVGSVGYAHAFAPTTLCALRCGHTDLTARPALRTICCQEGMSDPLPAAAASDSPPGPLCDFPGCDQNGRVMGGLAAIELFSWWPIKAYRPCPECAKNGVRYSRSGQTLDEIVFKKNPKGGYYGDD